jgi:outer membrane protein OmpA-like peptidoglycan-associated protein
MIKIAMLFLIGIFFACAKTQQASSAGPALYASTPPALVDPEEQLFMFDPNDSGKSPKGPIYFNMNSAEVVDSYKIDVLGRWLVDTRGTVHLVGHACPLGEDDYNYNLAERRAVAVKQHLMAVWNIPPERIRIDSRGESSPATMNPALFHLNRRVEAFTKE